MIFGEVILGVVDAFPEVMCKRDRPEVGVFELSERCGDQTFIHHVTEFIRVVDVENTHESVAGNQEVGVHLYSLEVCALFDHSLIRATVAEGVASHPVSMYSV